MKIKDNIKLIYTDGIEKVIKGVLIGEDDFFYTIKAKFTDEEIKIGKRAIVKISATGGNSNE